MVQSCKLSANMGEIFLDITLYRSLVGSLRYLTLTRLDIRFSVNQICQFLHNPKDDHFQAVKRIYRYLKGTSNLGLQITSCHEASSTLIAHCDLDWGTISDRRSIIGSSIWLGGNLLSWSAKKQPSVSLSSAEAEFKALAHVTSEIKWFCHLLHELTIGLRQAPLILCDNKSAIFMSLYIQLCL